MARSDDPAGGCDVAAWRAWLAARTPELSTWRAWLAGRMPELSIVASLLVVAGGLWLFLGIADEVREGELEAIDRRILLLFRDPLLRRMRGSIPRCGSTGSSPMRWYPRLRDGWA